jgi:hypothetical protein
MARSAAQALYPHLPSAERAEQSEGGPIASVMWPSLSREQKARECPISKTRRITKLSTTQSANARASR